MENLLKQINELYGLRVHSFEKVTKGFLSENHILFQDDEKYFLKRYRFDNKEKVEEIHSIKRYFANGGIPVILPITNKEGNTFFLFNNGYFALFPFAKGKQFERGLLTNEAAISMGEMLGKMHLMGKEATLSVKKELGIHNQEKSLEIISNIESKIKEKTELSDFDKLALENIQMKRRLMLSNQLNYDNLNLASDHLIHGDYLDQNIFFSDDDKVLYVFDFEKAKYAPRTYELFRSMVYCLLNGGVNKEKLEKAKLYLNSYLRVYPMTRDEIKIGLELFYLTLLRGGWVENEHYLKGNNRVDEFLSSDFRHIKYLSENLKELEDFLLK